MVMVLSFLIGVSWAQTSGQYRTQQVDTPGAAIQGTEHTPEATPGTGKPQVLPSAPVPVKPENYAIPPGSVNKGAGAGGTNSFWDQLKNRWRGGEHFNGAAGSSGEFFGEGKMEDCGQPPESANKALEEAVQFRQGCPVAQRGADQKIAINDYSSRPAYMYIFDQQKKCLGKTMVAFGNGAGGAQVACSDHGSHLSPPGFHLTAVHSIGSSKYHPGNSMKMVGLQGQDSVGRGVLLHATRAPGTSSTWGCAGVGYGALGAVMKTLGYGALMYNYWSPNQMAGQCRNKAGQSNNGQCRADPGSPAIPENATGNGSPAIAWLDFDVFSQAVATAFPPREFLPKGAEITIYRELTASGTYEISLTKEEAVGPNIATPEALMKALDIKESLKDFRKRLERDTGTIYVLKSPLPLLWDEEIYQLQQKRKKISK